jgi:glycosyltransferase involved in cell wall biosynthesis
LITIGIPTRNRASLVRDCVASALAQSYQNIEVLVSDNASTDGTLAILQCINDKRVRILSSWEDLGAHENFAKCIREARGDYLVLVSDDNFLDPAFLEKCVRLAKMEPGLPIVLAAYEILVIDEFSKNERRIVPAVTSKKLSTGIWDGTDILREYLQGRISAQLFSSIIRIDILRRRDGFSMHPCAGDEATWIPALLEGRAGLVNERCASYLVHGSSYSSGVSADSRFIDLCKVMEEISAIARHKIPDRARRLEIQKLTLRYVAYQTIITLVLYRRAGASLTDVVRKLWDWRPMLKRCTLRDFIAILRLRSLGRILLPEPLVRWSIALGLDRLL